MNMDIVNQIKEIIETNMNIIMWLVLSIGVVGVVDVLIRPTLKIFKTFKKKDRKVKAVIYQWINTLTALSIAFANWHLGRVITHSWFLDCFLVAMGAYLIHLIGWVKLREVVVGLLTTIPIIGKVFKKEA